MLPEKESKYKKKSKNRVKHKTRWKTMKMIETQMLYFLPTFLINLESEAPNQANQQQKYVERMKKATYFLRKLLFLKGTITLTK